MKPMKKRKKKNSSQKKILRHGERREIPTIDPTRIIMSMKKKKNEEIQKQIRGEKYQR
jgi:hypothetical protein